MSWGLAPDPAVDRDGPVTVRELDGDNTPEAARAVFQRFLRDFGGLLLAWADIVEAAKALRGQGIRLGRKII